MEYLQERFVNPLTDFGFKRLFGTEANKDILTAFLNELLPDHHQIEELEFLNSEQLGLNLLERRAIYDVSCRGKNGERFIVELQKARQKFFRDRSLFYATFPIQQMAKKNEWDFQLQPIYSIGILDFQLDDTPPDEDIIQVVEMRNQHCRVVYDKLKFIYVELPRFTKSLNELKTPLDKWLYLLRHLPDLSEIPALFDGSVFLKFMKSAELANMSRAERSDYEDSMKVHRDLTNVISTALEKGKAIGLKKQATDTARRMKASGVARQDILGWTGITPEQYDEL